MTAINYMREIKFRGKALYVKGAVQLVEFSWKHIVGYDNDRDAILLSGEVGSRRYSTGEGGGASKGDRGVA